MASAPSSTGVYLHSAQDLRLETRPLAPLGDGQVQVAIKATTLCGSDLHYYNHFRDGSILVREPLCLGHEAAGEVVALGPGIDPASSQIQVGDAVALEVGVPCGDCDYCRAKRYNICSGLRFRSSGSKFPHYQGTLQERVNHPARWMYKLPPEVNYEVGALLEPLAVAIHAVRRAEQCSQPVRKGSCLIFGAGAVGLLTAVAARASGFSKIMMTDIQEARLNFAVEHGFADASYTIRPKKQTSDGNPMDVPASAAAEIAQITWPDGAAVSKVDVSFECTGVGSCAQMAIYATASGGCVVLAGLGTPNVMLPVSEATAREITLVPTWRYADCYPEAVEIAKTSVTGTQRNGRKLPDIRLMITHRFRGLDSVATAFKATSAGGLGDGQLMVKTIITFP